MLLFKQLFTFLKHAVPLIIDQQPLKVDKKISTDCYP